MSTQPIVVDPSQVQSIQVDPSQVQAVGASQPGFLDKDIPLAGPWYNPTLSGIQSIGRGVRSAITGIGHTLDPNPEGDEPVVGGIGGQQVYRLSKSLADLGKETLEVPSAISDINSSQDPLSHYAKAAQDTAGEGAGQALVALGTEGLVRGIPAAVKAVGPVRQTAAESVVAPLVKTPLGMALENAKFGRNPASAIVDEGLVGTKQSLIEQSGKRLGELHDAADQALQQSPNAHVQIDIEPIIDQSIADAQTAARKVGNKAAVQRLSDLQDALKTEYGPIKGNPYEMNNLKRDIGDAASEIGAFKSTDPLEASAAGAMGDVYSGIKDAVNKQVPEVAPFNERSANLIAAKTALTRNLVRDAQQSILDSHTLYSAGAKTIKNTLASAPVRSAAAAVLRPGDSLPSIEGAAVSQAPTAIESGDQNATANASPESPAVAVSSQPANGRTNAGAEVHAESQPKLPVASGAPTNVTVPGSGNSYPAQYEVRDLSDIHRFEAKEAPKDKLEAKPKTDQQ